LLGSLAELRLKGRQQHHLRQGITQSGAGGSEKARERLSALSAGLLERFCGEPSASETDRCSVGEIETTEQQTAGPTCTAEQVPPVLEPAPEHVPPHKLERRSRRMVAAVLRRADARLYDWESADHAHYSPAEKAAIDAHRKRVLENAARADGSRLARLDGMHTPQDQRISRCIRDDAVYAETEWAKLQRHDPLYANCVFEAALGLREDGTCARDWNAQRARCTLQLAWLLWRAAGARLGSLGTLTVRGVSFEYLQRMSAPIGKARLHRNTLAGTHRSYSSRNEDCGYIVALQLAGALERFQYGDRRAENRQVNEYTLRVSTQNEVQAAQLDRHEAAYRELLRNRWERLAELDALIVQTGQQRALERRRKPDAREAELRAIIQADTGPPP